MYIVSYRFSLIEHLMNENKSTHTVSPCGTSTYTQLIYDGENSKKPGPKRNEAECRGKMQLPRKRHEQPTMIEIPLNEKSPESRSLKVEFCATAIMLISTSKRACPISWPESLVNYGPGSWQSQG